MLISQLRMHSDLVVNKLGFWGLTYDLSHIRCAILCFIVDAINEFFLKSWCFFYDNFAAGDGDLGKGIPSPGYCDRRAGPRFGVPPRSSPTPLRQSKIVAQAKPRLGAMGGVFYTPSRRAHDLAKS